MNKNIQPPICGIYIDNSTTPVHLAVRETSGANTITDTLNPFAWGTDSMTESVFTHKEKLNPSAVLNQLYYFEGVNNYSTFLQKYQTQGAIAIKPLEHQYLLQNNLRMFNNLRFSELNRCQLDIETATTHGAFSNPFKNRVLAIGLKYNSKDTYLLLEEDSDSAEKKLLISLIQYLKDNDPDLIEGHNIFKFDLEYLRIRSKLLGLKCLWGRFNCEAQFRNSRLKVAERLIDFPRCDIPGRTVVDTYFLVQLYDITKREMPSYSLKKSAVYFGIASNDRTYLHGHSIQDAFYTDRKTFLAYLGHDLYETQAIADLLLPTYFAQTQNFPMTLQEILLRGSVSKLETLFLEQYFHKKASLPAPSTAQPFEGGYTKSFYQGVFKNVLHFDIASLYPSLLLITRKNPQNDSLGCFIPLLKSFRSYRLEFKKKSINEPDHSLKKEYEARQQSFKILINSFYGYLGFNGALFGDSSLAAEITKKGRDLLHLLIKQFEKAGCRILEVDTDGLYLEANSYFHQPSELLEKIKPSLPEDIELEFDGAYSAMFCYKAKNYALYDGTHLIIKGSALKSRGFEPFLTDLTEALLKSLLDIKIETTESLPFLLKNIRESIQKGSFPIESLAKSEHLSMNPATYLKEVTIGSKPRRASLEIALKMNVNLKMGDKVTYFIADMPNAKKSTPDWQLAQPVSTYHPETNPYNKAYYLQKLDDWLKRYQPFIKE